MDTTAEVGGVISKMDEEVKARITETTVTIKTDTNNVLGDKTIMLADITLDSRGAAAVAAAAALGVASAVNAEEWTGADVVASFAGNVVEIAAVTRLAVSPMVSNSSNNSNRNRSSNSHKRSRKTREAQRLHHYGPF